MQFPELSCGGLHGKAEEFLFGCCARNVDVDIGNMWDEIHENLLTGS
jgi:hypothetical protein